MRREEAALPGCETLRVHRRPPPDCDSLRLHHSTQRARRTVMFRRPPFTVFTRSLPPASERSTPLPPHPLTPYPASFSAKLAAWIMSEKASRVDVLTHSWVWGKRNPSTSLLLASTNLTPLYFQSYGLKF